VRNLGSAAALVSIVVVSGTAGGLVLAADERVPFSRESVARGRTVYLQNCQDCHGDDGKAQGSAIAVAPDLTRPDGWKFGQGDAEIFANIKNGAGDNMPPFGPIGPGLKDAQIWDLVNYIRSIGPENRRPQP
jgi:mono/diheme cytochrome c family protein